MTVYIDGLLLLNFYLDFLLLLTTTIILKRNVSFFRILVGAFIGSLSIIILFFKVGCFELFLIKLYLGFLMCIICFGYRNIKYFLSSFGMFYLVSIILGGFIYFLNIQFKGFNYLFLCIFSPIILYLYSRQVKSYKCVISHYHKVDIYLLDMVLKLNGYFDSGNNLMFNNRCVIICNLNNSFNLKKYYVLCSSLGGSCLLECILVDKVIIDDAYEYKDIYLGFNKNMNLYGVDVLLNGRMEI